MRKADTMGVCVIGVGRAGMIHAHNFAHRIPHAHLVSLVDTDQHALKQACEKVEVAACHTDFREALQDERVDAVVVAAPTVLHRDIVVAAAGAGKHILCEKPMAMNVAECEQMLKAVKRNHVNLQLGFMRRFDTSFCEAKEVVDSGAIGDVVLVKSLTHGPSKPQPWMLDIHRSNGPLAEVSSHDIDTLRWFTESEFASVYAIAGNFRNPNVRDTYPDFYDNVVMNARFENGMQGIIDGAVYVRYGYDARVEVLGTHGIIFIGGTRENTTLVCDGEGRASHSFVKSWQTLYSEAYRREDEAFIEAIREERTPEVTGEDGMAAVAVVNAGNQSIREKRPVSPAHIGRL
jgi:myo-inositol 2-dehydrogenase/D-chiro-inositol 1-dehydrogenase/scyllo-inositol 2-dehydrogenase (NAD+)